MDRGYLIPAQGEQYHQCARALAKSIKYFMPEAKVATVGDCEDSVFDHCIKFDDPELGMRNDWQIYRVSPFHETIRLEADMILNGSIKHWWTEFEKRDVVVTTGTLNFYNSKTQVDKYRRHLKQNHLPDVYNAITYWRKSQLALDFGRLVKTLFDQWDEVKQGLVGWDNAEPDTDTVYAVAIRMLGEERLTLPISPKFVHMKGKINHCQGEDWTRELVWELTEQGLRINTIQQTAPTHYYIKSFSAILEDHYDKLLAS